MVVFNNSCYWFVKKGGGDQDNLGYEAATKGDISLILRRKREREREWEGESEMKREG